MENGFALTLSNHGRSLQQVAALIICAGLCLEGLQKKSLSVVKTCLFAVSLCYCCCCCCFCSDGLPLWYHANWVRYCSFWDNSLPQLHYQATVLSDSFLLFKVLSNKLYPFIHIPSLKVWRKLKRLTLFIKCSKSELSIGKNCTSIMENFKREKLKLQSCKYLENITDLIYCYGALMST